VTDKPTWARRPRDYAARADAAAARSRASTDADDRRRQDTIGITWAPFDVDSIQRSSVERSRHRFRSGLPDLIWNTAALEGNSFTLPEVRTLLDGVTVGGKRLAEEQQILALSDAYSRLDQMVAAGEFALTKSVSDELHRLLGRDEALESGHFRGEGSATGGGNVRLANGGTVLGVDEGPGGPHLLAHFKRLLDFLRTVDDPRHRALLYFASATRRQFYFDGNKRTARLMMVGELMSSGFDPISIPFSRKLEFNIALDELFTTDDATRLLRFLVTCTLLDR